MCESMVSAVPSTRLGVIVDRNRVGSDHNTATLSDVARLAGVSTATASKALNGRDQVKAETRERVFEAAQQLSFTPNPFARALNDKRTGTIGMLTSDLETDLCFQSFWEQRTRSVQVPRPCSCATHV